MATGILVLFCMALLNFGISIGELTLKHVIVTYRSPEHTPCDFKDGPNITNIPESNSTLTEKGVNRTFDLGKKLGEDYKSQFNLSQWRRKDYYSMGTPAPRCLMAAMNFGAGLENKESDKVTTWESQQQRKAKRQNVTFPHWEQYMMFLNTSKCPGFYTALGENLTTWKTDLNNSYFRQLQNISDKYPDVTTDKPCNVWLAYEIFQTQNETDQSKTEWLSKNNWKGLCDYSEKYIFDVESVEKLKKLSGGIMVDSILNVTELIINGSMPQGKNKAKTSSHKMSVLATSQAPLAAMLGAFTPDGTTYNGKKFEAKNFYPRNGAHHVVEIYQDGEGKSKSDFKVKVMYAPGGGNDKLSPLKYPECENDMCPYDKLEKALEKMRLPGKDQEKQCNPNKTQKPK